MAEERRQNAEEWRGRWIKAKKGALSEAEALVISYPPFWPKFSFLSIVPYTPMEIGKGRITTREENTYMFLYMEKNSKSKSPLLDTTRAQLEQLHHLREA